MYQFKIKYGLHRLDDSVQSVIVLGSSVEEALKNFMDLYGKNFWIFSINNSFYQSCD